MSNPRGVALGDSPSENCSKIRAGWAAAPGAAATFERGRAEADRRGDVRLGTGYLLLGLLEDRDGIASQVVSDLGVDCVHLCAEATDHLSCECPTCLTP